MQFIVLRANEAESSEQLITDSEASARSHFEFMSTSFPFNGGWYELRQYENWHTQEYVILETTQYQPKN